jgi:hypothetical protein
MDSLQEINMKTRISLLGIAAGLLLGLIATLTNVPAKGSRQDAQAPAGSKETPSTYFASHGLAIPVSNWMKVAFEAGVNYGPSDQIAQTTINCPEYAWAADWYAHSISWTTGAPLTPTKDSSIARPVLWNGATIYVVANGTYSVFANNYTFDHSLVGHTTTATINLRIHCVAMPYAYQDLPTPQPISIYDRIDVDKVVAPHSVKGGQAISLVIWLKAPAQPSNTRVYLTWSGNGLPLIGTVPDHLDIPPLATQVTLMVPTDANTAGTKNVTVKATTLGSQQATIQITP